MKKKEIYANVCDARKVTEESLAGFDSILIKAGTLITGARAKGLMNRYPITLKADAVIEAPEDQDIAVTRVDGSFEIGPDADGTGTFLCLTGELTIADGSQEAVKSYFRIDAAGEVLMPRSYGGRFPNLSITGTTVYYPDGAFILKKGAQVDDLFVARAAHKLYYCPKDDLFFLDTEMDVEKLLEKGLRFSGKRVVMAESLLGPLVSRIDEETELVRVPDGTKFIDDDLELDMKTIQRYGTKLFVTGDVSIQDGEALSHLEYLYTDGDVSVRKDLEEAFEKIESVYEELEIVDPDMGYISHRPTVTVNPDMLKSCPGGVRVKCCSVVTLSEELSPEDITEKLRIFGCAVVVCTAEQQAAANMIAKHVAAIRVPGPEPKDGAEAAPAGDLSGGEKDTLVIKTFEYRL